MKIQEAIEILDSTETTDNETERAKNTAIRALGELLDILNDVRTASVIDKAFMLRVLKDSVRYVEED